ncbi:PCI domain-containing protein 2 isoform X2 [Lepus europaeus]|uniref:PCI domain-containing protein 2 isoform X2 n=1 Tax=Lepus europaeus TaxID=9983 RepID=UPI002B475245|nr:PCI domain-containing protein 2 isoform X2 [Lepus europaeus]XP_062049901.1 PCI domain-containing protein 2 isoform X2 [Lepus europaeus]
MLFPANLVYEAIDTRDGASCAELVSFKHPHVANPRLQMASPEEKCQQVLEPPYDEMFAAHLRCTYAVGNHDFIEAYKCQTVIVQSFLRAFQAHKEENWALPVMYAVALDLRVFANNADQQLVKKGKSKVGDMLEKAAELLMSCFRVCASDTRAGIEDSKKWGMLFLVNQLFKIYFKINKLHLCKPLIRAIDSSNLKDDYSTAQRVTYKYYVGRKAMFDSDFKQAEEYLSFAFEHCHRSSQKNKRMILIYLLPVKMLLGHMPTIELLKKYHLMQFAEVTKAVSEGSLLLLNEALAKHETFFIRCGIFLILEKLKIITYRNLFKKVRISRELDQKRSSWDLNCTGCLHWRWQLYATAPALKRHNWMVLTFRVSGTCCSGHTSCLWMLSWWPSSSCRWTTWTLTKCSASWPT